MLQRLKRHWWRIVGLACIFGSFWLLWKGTEVDRRWDEQMEGIDQRWNANSELVRAEVEVLRRAQTEKDQLESAIKLATLQADKVKLRREELETSRRLFEERGFYYSLFSILWGIGFNVLWIGPFIARVRARWRRRSTDALSARGTDRTPVGESQQGARDAVEEGGRLMDETEWPVASNPTAMLEETELTSERKLRLFAVACCRRVWEQLGAESRQAVDIAEQYADGAATSEQLAAACETTEEQSDQRDAQLVWSVVRPSTNASGFVLEASAFQADSQVPTTNDDSDREKWEQAGSAESAAQADLLREIFGNPFRPVALDPAWLTSTVTALAKQMYESGDFSLMPVLADALQDAGCDNADVLDHCRGSGPHVRGCWVVDLVLGKS
jgi:hypothetical protein